MKITLGVLLLFLSQTLWAMDHVQEIAKAQSWADSFKTDYPIHIFNRDQMNYLFAQKNVLGEEKEQERLQVIGEYLQTNLGLTLETGDLATIDTYLTDLPSSAVAQPIGDLFGHQDTSAYKLCAVFPNPPNGNARIETERLTGLDREDLYHGHDYSQLTKKMTFEELYLFSLYHEVGHCLDQHFLPKNYAYGGGESPHSIHLSEAFAEVMAYLSLSERLGLEIADSRSLYRALYSRVMGEHLTTLSSFGNPNLKSGGAIYFLTPYLMEAYQDLKFKELEVDFSKPSSFLDAAYQVVREKEYTSRELTAIRMMLTDGYEVTQKKYEEMAYKSPEFFYNTYVALVNYKTQTDYFLNYAFDSEAPEEDASQGDLEVPVEALCEQVQKGSFDGFNEALNQIRSGLQNQNYNHQSSFEAYGLLNELGGLLQESCSVKDSTRLVFKGV